MGTTVDMQKVTYDCCDESYPDMTFTFQLQRSSPAYRALMVLPCLGTYLTNCTGPVDRISHRKWRETKEQLI